jgi:hypothetical protein
VAAAAAMLGAGSAIAQPTMVPPQVIDGPNADIVSLGGMSIARDGTGGIVYVKNVAGAPHVFVARLLGGAFQSPQQVDAGLSGSSSGQPVIAATVGGGLFVAFVEGGELYVTQVDGSAAAWSSPQGLSGGATAPSIAFDGAGLGYLAFTTTAAGGDDVMVDYYDGTEWSAVTSPMNVTPGDQAGTSGAEPEAATAGDGVGIVTWGENGHVYSRRVWADAPSVEVEQLDPPSWSGWTETTADSPSISTGGDSSYAAVVFRETLASGRQTQTRALMTRLVAEQTQPTVAVDGLGTPGANAAQPAVAINEYGRGFTTAMTDSDNVVATQLTTNATPAGTQQVNTDANTATPYATPGLAGLVSTLIAWQETPLLGQAQIELRFAQDGSTLGPEMLASAPSSGPTQAADGLATGGDNIGDAAVAWVQGSPGALSIDAVQLFQPPHQPTATQKLVYTRDSQPVLDWTPASVDWGPITYSATLDEASIGQTQGTSITVPTVLADGPHAWQVTASNPAALTSTSPSATVFVDTTPPHLRLTLKGKAQVGDTLTARLSYTDPVQPGEPGAQASGIAAVSLKWGDGSPTVSKPRLTSAKHVYKRKHVELITARVTDRAGNITQVTRRITVRPRPVPKHKKPKRHAKRHAQRRK